MTGSETPVKKSPMVELLDAVDTLDVEAVTALFEPDARLLLADGRLAEGGDAVRELLTDLFGGLRSASHRTTDEWNDGNVWIAEAEASYELQDWTQTGALPRAIVLRMGSDGIADVRVYGANEHALAEYATGQEGLWIGGRWMPPL
jgi:ketosteroid isomerase-like protein